MRALVGSPEEEALNLGSPKRPPTLRPHSQSPQLSAGGLPFLPDRLVWFRLAPMAEKLLTSPSSKSLFQNGRSQAQVRIEVGMNSP